jgi:hypothetical protein
MAEASPPLLRPVPRRPFDLSSRTPVDSPGDSQPASPDPSEVSRGTTSGATLAPNKDDNSSFSNSRSRSILNLTSSTLFGIYSPTTSFSGDARDYSEPATPWGTGAETPARHYSFDVNDSSLAAITSQQKLVRAAAQQLRQKQLHQGSTLAQILPLAGRLGALFAFGVLYGVLVSHLHDSRNMSIVPVKVEGLDHSTWSYLAFWGVAGVALGTLLPIVDKWLEGESQEKSSSRDKVQSDGQRVPADEVGWSRMIRSVGAFVGIAFAIVCFPHL